MERATRPHLPQRAYGPPARRFSAFDAGLEETAERRKSFLARFVLQASLYVALFHYRSLVGTLAEELVGIFNAVHSLPEEHGIGDPCVLFLTNTRIIVVPIEGIDYRVFFVPVVALIIAFAGLFLKVLTLLSVGIVVALVSSLVLIWANSTVRNRRIRKAKTLSPDDILKFDEHNFEIPYKEVSKTELERFEELKRGSVLIPSMPEYDWTVRLIPSDETHERYVFTVKSDTLKPFLECIRQFVPEISEIEDE